MMPPIYRLPSDEAPRYVGVDMASGDDFTAEVEVEILPDGAIRVLDVRYHPPKPMKGDRK